MLFVAFEKLSRRVWAKSKLGRCVRLQAIGNLRMMGLYSDQHANASAPGRSRFHNRNHNSNRCLDLAVDRRQGSQQVSWFQADHNLADGPGREVALHRIPGRQDREVHLQVQAARA